MDKVKRHSKKLAIGIIGGVVLILGVVLIPYPGPGWLIVFAGLAILSTEFVFAQKSLDYARNKYDGWTDWLKVQPWYVQVISLTLTGLVVLVTVYLLNAFGIINSLLNLDQQWLVSPFFR